MVLNCPFITIKNTDAILNVLIHNVCTMIPQYQLLSDAHDCYHYLHKKGRRSYVVLNIHLPTD